MSFTIEMDDGLILTVGDDLVCEECGSENVFENECSDCGCYGTVTKAEFLADNDLS